MNDMTPWVTVLMVIDLIDVDLNINDKEEKERGIYIGAAPLCPTFLFQRRFIFMSIMEEDDKIILFSLVFVPFIYVLLRVISFINKIDVIIVYD